MTALDVLLDAWRNHPVDEALHSMDERALERSGLKSELTPLTPYPYAGDLRSARVWILMRNPGVGPNDYKEEKRHDFRSLLTNNLNQEFGDYPFLHLSPNLAGTDASNYWWRKRNFRELSKQLGGQLGTTSEEARKQIAQRVAILELCPYRKETFDQRMADIPSAKLARAALSEALREAKETGNRAFVTPWSPHAWPINGFLHEPFVRNHLGRTFTFRQGAVSGFGEVIAKFAFGLLS